jgi:5-hydroxyisourate hydrolase
MASPITTHVLDLGRGRPGMGIAVALDRLDASGHWQRRGEGLTDTDGRCRTLLPDGTRAEPGTWRLRFETGRYFGNHGQRSFYPHVDLVFEVTADGGDHYHVPLLVNAWGYSTYRGS